MTKIDPNLDPNGPDVPLWEKGQASGRSRPLDQAALFGITKEVVDVFNQLGIRYCLSHGTALGVTRDGDAIPWDDDVDLAIFSTDRPKLAEARARLRGLGFYVPEEGDPTKPVDPKSNMPWYDFVAIKNGEKVECWIFDKVGKHYIYDPARSGLAIPQECFETSTALWRGHTFFMPGNIDHFLDLMYGLGWRTPDKDKKYNELRVENYA